MNKEDNVIFVLQIAIRRFKIRVTENSVKEFLLAHPHYPSLKSVCDALTKWKVTNYPLNLELEEIKTLEMLYVAHLKVGGGQLAFVEKTANNQVTYFITEGKRIEETFEKFSEKLSGAVVVLEAGIESGEKEYRQHRQNEILNKSLLPLGIISLMAWAIYLFVSKAGGVTYQSGYLFWGLLATKITGLTASVFLVLHELKIHTPLADKICGFSSKTDCDTVLSSNASQVFGWVNWADAGIIYFTGTLIYLLGINAITSLWILAFISALALPYPVFSIYYQAVKAKKWCPFCLMVQVVLIAEFILLLPVLLQVNISIIQVLQFGVSFLIPVALWFLYRAYRSILQEHNKMRYSYLGFKRNPEIFRFLLRNNGQQDIPVSRNSLVLGNPDAPVTVTAFLSLYCSPCATAYEQIKHLLDKCSNVKIHLIFKLYDNNESQELIHKLYYLYSKNGSIKTLEFLDKWYSTIKPSRIDLYKNIEAKDFKIYNQIEDENKKLFIECNVAGTPTIFVNGYKYPGQYEYSDIEFYIDELKKLNVESRRQEACTNCH